MSKLIKPLSEEQVVFASLTMKKNFNRNTMRRRKFETVYCPEINKEISSERCYRRCGFYAGQSLKYIFCNYGIEKTTIREDIKIGQDEKIELKEDMRK